MTTIDFLDKALLYIKSQVSFIPTRSEIPEFTPDENKLLPRAFYKLEKDGYVYTDTKTDEKGNKSVRFYISFDGLLALESSSLIWKNRPYRWNKNKQVLTAVWTAAKIIAITINAIIILIFTYLTYYNKS